MTKSNLYTRTGDTGMTSLVGGTRVKKNCPRLEAYGTLDEFSSFLGALAADDACGEETRTQLRQIQNMLFNLGGYLACESKEDERLPVWGLKEEHLKSLESWIDTLDADTPKIHSFVLPGGSEASAKAHIARSVCRRAERRIFDLADCEYVDPLLLRYINRLSDYLFILARNLNFKAGVEEIIWEKEK